MNSPLQCVWAAFDKQSRRAALQRHMTELLGRTVPPQTVTALQELRHARDKESFAEQVDKWSVDGRLGDAAKVVASKRVQVLENTNGNPVFEWYPVLDVLQRADDVYIGPQLKHDAVEEIWSREGENIIVKANPGMFESLQWNRISEVDA